MSVNQSKSKLQPTDPKLWTVEDEVPKPIPVPKAGLDAIEQYFDDLLYIVFEFRLRAVPAVPVAHRKGTK